MKKTSTSKNKVIMTFIICTILFATLTCFMIYHYMSPRRGTIYVFNNAYSAGDQISSDMLTPLQVDSTIIAAGRSSDVGSQFVTPVEYTDIVRSGDSLRIDVGKGMPLTTSMLSVSGGSSVEMNMTSDAIAVTVEVNKYTGITNDLKEGARVNVYANINSGVHLIQQNKRVLEVYKSDGELSGISLEENIYESMELIYAATNGDIYLGLVDGTGYQSSEGADPVYDGKDLSGISTVDESDDFLDYIDEEGQLDLTEETEPETEAVTEAETEPVSEENSAGMVFTP